MCEVTEGEAMDLWVESLQSEVAKLKSEVAKLEVEVTKLDVYAKLMFWRGVVEGLMRYAHWKDGCQYVGLGGRTLNDAIEDVRREAGASLEAAGMDDPRTTT